MSLVLLVHDEWNIKRTVRSGHQKCGRRL